MRHIRYIFLLAIAFCYGLNVRAQQIVIDPSQIAASATNAAEQVDYMLDQLGELAYLGDQINVVKGYIDNVFGEDGIGTKAVDILNDLGTLARLTESFNSMMKMTEQYAEQMKKLGNYRLADVNMMLSYLRTMQNQAELAIETAKSILDTLGFSKKEKKDEIDKIIAETEEQIKTMRTMMEIETQSTLMAEGLNEFLDFIDEDITVDNYVAAKSRYGSAKSAASSSLGVISIILGLLGIGCCVWGYMLFVSGGIAGDPTSEQVFLRIGGAFIGGMIVLNLISSMFNLNL